MKFAGFLCLHRRHVAVIGAGAGHGHVVRDEIPGIAVLRSTCALFHHIVETGCHVVDRQRGLRFIRVAANVGPAQILICLSADLQNLAPCIGHVSVDCEPDTALGLCDRRTVAGPCLGQLQCALVRDIVVFQCQRSRAVCVDLDTADAELVDVRHGTLCQPVRVDAVVIQFLGKVVTFHLCAGFHHKVGADRNIRKDDLSAFPDGITVISKRLQGSVVGVIQCGEARGYPGITGESAHLIAIFIVQRELQIVLNIVNEGIIRTASGKDLFHNKCSDRRIDRVRDRNLDRLIFNNLAAPCMLTAVIIVFVGCGRTINPDAVSLVLQLIGKVTHFLHTVLLVGLETVDYDLRLIRSGHDQSDLACQYRVIAGRLLCGDQTVCVFPHAPEVKCFIFIEELDHLERKCLSVKEILTVALQLFRDLQIAGRLFLKPHPELGQPELILDDRFIRDLTARFHAGALLGAILSVIQGIDIKIDRFVPRGNHTVVDQIGIDRAVGLWIFRAEIPFDPDTASIFLTEELLEHTDRNRVHLFILSGLRIRVHAGRKVLIRNIVHMCSERRTHFLRFRLRGTVRFEQLQQVHREIATDTVDMPAPVVREL